MTNVITDYLPSDTDRFFCYAWYDKLRSNETKFGDRWVFAGIDPTTSCKQRIREQAQTRKDLVDDGSYRMVAIWDVSDIAKEANRFHKHGKIDDYIRKDIGFVKQSEVHSLAWTDLKLRVDAIVSKSTQIKPIVKLSTAQYEIVAELKIAIANGHRRFLGELAARIGKTIASSSLSMEIDVPITIITSYVKTVFTSFRSDITSFEQFRDIVHINCDDDTYQEQISVALRKKQKIFVYFSLCNGSKRQSRIDFLFGLKVQRLVIVDEADFGAHRKNQVQPLKDAIDDDDILFLMTGTNADRAVSEWDIDYMLSVTYFELLVQKTIAVNLLKQDKKSESNPLKLTHFNKDIKRDVSYPSVLCYQMDLIESVNQSIKLGLVPDVMKTLPTWTKFVKHPIKAKGWYIRVLQSLFQGKHNLPALNVDLQTIPPFEGRRVSMMFFPDGTRREMLDVIGQISQQALPEFEIVVLHGKHTTQEKAEKYVKEVMYKNPNKSILILSSKIGQRSFSVAKLDELYLAYDKGQNGATIQKMSRALTPDDSVDDKMGKIYSLSFDSNRDDKFDTMIIQTALNLVKGKKSTEVDIQSELKKILGSIDIFTCTDDGSIKVDVDTFITEALKRKTISKVMGMKTDIHNLSPEMISALANGNIDYVRNEPRESAKMGKTKEPETNKKRKNLSTPPNVHLKEQQRVREMFTTIYENSDILLKSAKPLGAKNIKDCFRVFEEQAWEDIISSEFGVSYDIIKELFFQGKININWVNLLHNN
jgi:hypothetical protein